MTAADGEPSQRFAGRKALWGYAVVVVAEVLLSAGLVALRPIIPLGDFPILYVWPIMFAAFVFGEGAAILAFVLGFVLFDYYFLAPRFSVWPIAENSTEWARVAAFFIGAGVVVVASVMVRRSMDRAVRYAQELSLARSEAERLYQREHYIADVLQHALMPAKIPTDVEDWRIHAKYQPALDEAMVGGDFYDIFYVGERRIGVLIGDVAGKGIRAAVRVAAARHSIRSYAFLDPSPAKVLTLANAALCREESDEANLLTAFYALVDLDTGLINYATGGHEPPVVCGPDGGALGFFKDFTYEESTYQLMPGERMVMVTDGITEARRTGPPFNSTGVIRELMTTCNAEPEEIVEGLFSAATDYAGGRLRDDAAIIILAYEGKGMAQAVG